MERKRLPIFLIGSLQRREGKVINQIRIKDTPQSVFKMLREEVDELGEAIEKNDRKEIMCEVGDVILLCSRLAVCTGFKLFDSINGKLRRNNEKYNPKKLRRLQNDWGLTPEESMDFAKEHWDRSQDARFFPN